MKKILVTGAAGFVGRHIIKHLLDEGHEVHAVDSLVPGGGGIDPDDGWPLYNPRDYNYKRFHFNCEDFRHWSEWVKDDDFDYAYHLAAVVGGREMIEKNPLSVADDLSIDAAYWQWAAVARPKKSVIFSSSAVYPVYLQGEEGHGEHRWRLLKEDDVSFVSIGRPDMSYGWAKLTCEYLAKLAHERHGLKSIVYRPFSGYGVDQSDAYPFPAICKRALERRHNPTMEVWGSGRQMRDFIHIDDVVRAVAATVDRIDDAGAVNLSTGILTGMADLARMAAKAAGNTPLIVGSTDKPEGVFARGGSIEKLLGLGYCPSWPLEVGVKEAIEYYSERMR